MTLADESQRQQTLLRVLLRDEGPEALAHQMREGGGPAFQRGLQAYRAHAGALAVRVLAAAYPTLQPLLGAAAFGVLARAFWRHSPPTNGELALWGADLPSFVATAPDLAAEPYLADVARLDWALHCAATAADLVATAFSLQQMAHADSAALRLVPQAGTALVVSAHPVVSIWQAHHAAVDDQANAAEKRHLFDAENDSAPLVRFVAAGPAVATQPEPPAPPIPADRYAAARHALQQGRAETALVWRQGWRVQVAALATQEAHFTAQVLQGRTLGAALCCTTDAGPFDFQAWLLLQLQRGWLAGAEGGAPG